MESDYQEQQTIDTRVVMGEETQLKTTENQKGKPLSEPSAQANIPLFSRLRAQTKETQLGSTNDKIQSQTLQKQENQDKDHVQPPVTHPISSSESTPTGDISDVQGDRQNLAQAEVPLVSVSALSSPVALSFSEPTYTVDPLRVGVPSSLDPDLYYTAPSTPIKVTTRSSHLKHHSYPGSPAFPLSPGSPSDSEELCSPLTSPSGSYITAEGGSWTSSYTSSVSPSTSPNLLLVEETQEAPACFVGSLSEIGDEVGEERGRLSSEREEERPGDFCQYQTEDFDMNSQRGITDTVIPEEEVLKEEKISIPRGTSCPYWVTENASPERSSSSSDSQEDGRESESSLCPLEEASVGKSEYSRPRQIGLRLQLDACTSDDHFRQMDAHTDVPSTAFTPDTENMTMASSSLSPDSPLLSLDAFCHGVFDRLGPSSFILSQSACAEDLLDEERMIPASLISFPLHTNLIFKADSMEITLFPTEEENETEVNDRDEGKDVDAYADGEEEADVEDGNDDEEENDQYDYEGGNADVTPDSDEGEEDDHESNEQDETGEDAEVEVKVVEEENEDESESKAEEDPTDEDSSGSFLHSLSETSINEGLDDSFCFQDDSDDSLDSASYNGEEDERLYSTERHAQPLEPIPADGLDPSEIQSKAEMNSDNNEPLHTQPSLDEEGDHKMVCASEAFVAESKSDGRELINPEADLESETANGVRAITTLQSSTDKPAVIQELSHTLEENPCQPESCINLNEREEGKHVMSDALFCYLVEEPKDSPRFNLPFQVSSNSASDFKNVPAPATDVQETSVLNSLVLPKQLAVENSQVKDVALKQPSESTQAEPPTQPERDSFKLLIKPRHSHFESQRTVGASQVALSKSFSAKYDVPMGGNSQCRSGIEFDIELEQSKTSAESVSRDCTVSDSVPPLDTVTPTNDLNKGVLLLSCPKDQSPNPSNIPVSATPEVTSEHADNCILTPEHCPSDSTQENLRENMLSADEVVLGAVGSSHSPLAISPKRENSEMDTSREIGYEAGAWCDTRMGLGFGLGFGTVSEFGVWGAGESLSLSLGSRYELEAESLLMCDTECQRTMHSQVCENFDNVLGSILDEEDNNSLSGKKEQMAEKELIEEGLSESNLAHWKSVEEISEACSGEDESSRISEDNVTNFNPDNDNENKDAQMQDHWKISSESAFDSSEEGMYGSLNALSDEVRHQSLNINVRQSVSNIPLEDLPLQLSNNTFDEEQEAPQGHIKQTSDVKPTEILNEVVCSVSTGTNMNATANGKPIDSPRKTESRCDTTPEHQSTSPERNAFLLPQGSFGSFSPKCTLGIVRSRRICEDKVENAVTGREQLPTDSQRDCGGSLQPERIVGKPKTKDAFSGHECVVCNSGDVGEEGKTKEKSEEKKTENENTSSSPNDSEHFAWNTPKGGLCTDTQAASMKERRRKQNKHRVPQTGSHADFSPDSVDDPKKPLIPLNPMKNNWSKETADSSKTNAGHDASDHISSGFQQRKCDMEKVESGSQIEGHYGPSSDFKSPRFCNSNKSIPDNLNTVVAMNPDLDQQQELLYNKPLPDTQKVITTDINDNNIDAATLPNTSSTCPSAPFASGEPLDGLSTPIQESQPVLSAQELSSSPTHQNTPAIYSTSTVTQPSPESGFPRNNNLQDFTDVLSATSITSPSLTTAMPLILSQATQETGTLDVVCVPESPSHSYSSQSQSSVSMQSHKQNKQGQTGVSKDRCRGEQK